MRWTGTQNNSAGHLYMNSHSKKHTPPLLFDRLDEITEKLRTRRNVNVFLDYDGTLAPIAPTPDKARMPPDTLPVLQKIRDLPQVFLAIISGRSLVNIMKTVSLNGIHYAGNHGLEISGARKTEIVPNAAHVTKSIKKMCTELENEISAMHGAWIENKGLTASVHYREVALIHVPDLNRLIGRITAPYVHRDIVRLTRGKKVIEIRPAMEWNKGFAVNWMLKKMGKKKAVTIYIGDDTTDEDAFRMLPDAITIKVSRDAGTRTDAAYLAADTNEVRSFLHWLYERLTER
jgi:trehalose-phosphatase